MDETYQILLGLRERYEAHHKLRYTDDSLDAAAKYSSQYISDRFLPDKVSQPSASPGSGVSCVPNQHTVCRTMLLFPRSHWHMCNAIAANHLAFYCRIWQSR